MHTQNSEFNSFNLINCYFYFRCSFFISISFFPLSIEAKSSISNQPITSFLQFMSKMTIFSITRNHPHKAPPLPLHARKQTYSSSLASSVRALRRAPSTAGALNPMAAHLAFRMRLKSGLTRETMRNRDLTSMGRLQPGGAVSLL